MSQEPILRPGSARRISYAPNHEDILLDRLFGDHVGTFMNVGVSHPTAGNLTYFFYCRGWRGVNLEPIPRRLAQLQAARPGDLNLPLAAWDSNGEIPCSEAEGVPTVPVRTIRSLVEELEIDPPELLVIGPSGSVAPVLGGIALDSWRPGVLVVASSRPDPAGSGGHHEWEPELLEHGYRFATFNGVNRFYLRDDLGKQRARLELPVSTRDRFERWEVVALEKRVRDLDQESSRLRADVGRLGARTERLERTERERNQLQRECAALRQELVATQRSLRPYRLIDQLGVVTLGYRWARKLKPKRAS